MTPEQRKTAYGAARSSNAKSLKSLTGAAYGAATEQSKAYLQVIENITEEPPEQPEVYNPHTPLCCSGALGARRAAFWSGDASA